MKAFIIALSLLALSSVFSAGSLASPGDPVAACEADIARIERESGEFYQMALAASRGGTADAEAHRQFRKLAYALKLVEKNRPNCFDAVARSYALTATENNKVLKALFEAGLVKPLSLQARKDLGGIWLDRDIARPDKFTIMGAYDCNSSTIYFDPYMPPADLAAALHHELTHFTRDKYGPMKTSLGAREAVLLDETLAALAAATRQTSSHNFEYRNQAPRDNSSGTFDYMLYDRQGNLVKIIKDMNLSDQEATLEEVLNFALAEPMQRARLAMIFESIARVYFPGSSISGKALVQKIRMMIATELLPRFDFREGKFLATAQTVSRNCKAYSAEMAGARLDNYIGAKVPVPVKPGNEGVKPGNEGVKPGNEGVKPGNEGVKPGNEGVKPGNEGVKPGNEGVKPGRMIMPCLRPAEGL